MSLEYVSIAGPFDLVTALRREANARPARPVFTFLADGGETALALSYRELDRQARAIAAALQARGLRGERVLLLYVPGLEFIAALFGCLYAGAVAVPAYPPTPGQGDRALPRLQAIVADADPALVLSTAGLLEVAQFVFEQAPELARLPRDASDRLALAGVEERWQEVTPDPADVALIQYTSGSTATPKGVCVTHGALAVNLQMIARASRHDADTIVCSWLPFYHDFGLVGGILLPVSLGARAVLLPPFDFLQRPIAWLRALQAYGATDSFVPNFALDLCVRKTTAEERRSLDLSRVERIVVAAEPVRPATLERFAEVFAAHGLRRGRLFPAYGLAEAVVGVSGGPFTRPCRVARIDRDELGRGRWVESEGDDRRTSALAGCGEPLPGVEVVVVDPATRRPLPDGGVGELWVRGPNVASGYWNRPEASAETFDARLADGDPRSFLRTGDLAALVDGEVFITGRIKDLIVVRGRNHYPQDLERTVERCDPRIRPGCTAAFAVEADGEERVVLVAEVDVRDLQAGAPREQALRGIVRAMVAAIGREHGLRVHAAALLRARSIDKTSSGKIARHAARQRFLAGTLPTELLWTAEATGAPEEYGAGAPAEASRGPALSAALREAAPAERRRRLAEYVEGQLRAVVGHHALHLSAPEAPMQAAGLDSLGALDLAGRVERDLGVALPVGALLDGMSARALVDHLLREVARDQDGSPTWSPRRLLVLQPVRVRRPLFFVGGAFGASLYLQPLARALGEGQPFFALQYPGLGADEAPLRTVEEMARCFLADVRAVQPEGPYMLGGHSFGGLVAYEMAQQLLRSGAEVSHLFLADTSPVVESPADAGDPELMALFELLNCFLRLAGRPAGAGPLLDELAGQPPDEQRRRLQAALARQDGVPPGFPLDRLLAIFAANVAAMRRYRPLPIARSAVLLRAQEGFPARSLHPGRAIRLRFHEATFGWEEVVGRLQVIAVPGDHFSMVTAPHVQGLGAEIRRRIEDAAPMELGPERLAARRGPVRERGSDEAGPPVAFYPFREDYIEDPYPLLDALRSRDPVHWSPLGAWCVTRHRDISAGLRDRRFSVDKSFLAGEVGAPADPAQDPILHFCDNSMMFLDPPRHTRMRRLLASAFEPGAVKRWRGSIERTTEELLAGLRAHPEPDVIRDFAFPLPTAVIAEMLGLPREDVPVLLNWTRDVARMLDFVVSREDRQVAQASAASFTEYMRAHVRRRRRAGQSTDDLLTRMLAAEADGERLTMDELLANCLLLFSAGYITTTNTLGNAVLALSQAPEQARLLRARPERIDRAVEELLRFDGAVRQTLRTATEDVELGGKQIRRGDLVIFVLAAGNRDPEVFPDPHRLDLTREAKQHLAFAHGIHYCLGAALARIELQVAVLAVVQRLPTLRILPDGTAWQRSIALRGLTRMRVAFDGPQLAR